MAYFNSTYLSLVADIYRHLKQENCVKTLTFCEGTHWSLVADIHLYISMYKGEQLHKDLGLLLRYVFDISS